MKKSYPDEIHKNNKMEKNNDPTETNDKAYIVKNHFAIRRERLRCVCSAAVLLPSFCLLAFIWSSVFTAILYPKGAPYIIILSIWGLFEIDLFFFKYGNTPKDLMLTKNGIYITPIRGSKYFIRWADVLWIRRVDEMLRKGYYCIKVRTPHRFNEIGGTLTLNVDQNVLSIILKKLREFYRSGGKTNFNYGDWLKSLKKERLVLLIILVIGCVIIGVMALAFWIYAVCLTLFLLLWIVGLLLFIGLYSWSITTLPPFKRLREFVLENVKEDYKRDHKWIDTMNRRPMYGKYLPPGYRSTE